MSDDLISSLRERILDIVPEFEEFFKITIKECEPHEDGQFEYRGEYKPDVYWSLISKESKQKAKSLLEKTLPICAEIANQTKVSILTSHEDLEEVKRATKIIRASLHLREYWYSEPQVIHEDGSVLGITPSKQGDDRGATPRRAWNLCWSALDTFRDVLRLIEASPIHDNSQNGFAVISGEVGKYKPNSAFIMMWMDSKQPDLEDLADTVRSIFRKFNIRALRADDIEHEGQISDRVLNEIRSAEFLFADLTGTRPNVYYEVGYAHALGKRVILFRKSGTSIHFDLAGYNCPEYENLKDLKEKLTKRLSAITNKSPRQD